MSHNAEKDAPHNHVTRDIKPRGQCPGCDRYHNRHSAENDAAHVVAVVYDFQGRSLHSCLRCHYAGFSAPELPCPGPVCRHCGEPIREGEMGVDWPWIHAHGVCRCHIPPGEENS